MAYTIDGWCTLLSFKQNPKKLRIWELKEHPNKGWGGGGEVAYNWCKPSMTSK